jgi:hypothetical protein
MAGLRDEAVHVPEVAFVIYKEGRDSARRGFRRGGEDGSGSKRALQDRVRIVACHILLTRGAVTRRSRTGRYARASPRSSGVPITVSRVAKMVVAKYKEMMGGCNLLDADATRVVVGVVEFNKRGFRAIGPSVPYISLP